MDALSARALPFLGILPISETGRTAFQPGWTATACLPSSARAFSCLLYTSRRTGFDGYLTAEVFREDSAVPEIPYEKFYSAVAKAMDRILEENEKEQ